MAGTDEHGATPSSPVHGGGEAGALARTGLSHADVVEALAAALQRAGVGCDEWSRLDRDSGCPDCADLERLARRLAVDVEHLLADQVADLARRLRAGETWGDGQLDALALLWRRGFTR